MGLVCAGEHVGASAMSETQPIVFVVDDDVSVHPRSVVFLEHGGRFKCRVEGPVSGNVLLRRAHHGTLSEPARALAVARHIVAGKVQNSRQVLLRGAREALVPEDVPPLQEAAQHLAEGLPRLEAAQDLDQVRGIDGSSALVCPP